MTRNAGGVLKIHRALCRDAKCLGAPFQDGLVREFQPRCQGTYPASYPDGIVDRAHKVIGTLEVPNVSTGRVPYGDTRCRVLVEATPMGTAHLLRTERERRSLDQHEVAAAIGVSRPTVTQWEAGTKKPGTKNARKLAMFFKLPLEAILGEDSSAEVIRASQEEIEAVHLLRHAPAHIREAVLTLLRSAAAVGEVPNGNSSRNRD